MPPDRSHDVFISYAHADDEIPVGAASGWVTTLVDELKKVLRRKLGGAGADIWMDHQLAGNERVPDLRSLQRDRSGFVSAQHERDRSLAVLVSHALADLGVAPVAGAEPDPDQAPGENRLAQSNLLERCHGVVIIYGQSAKSWVASQFMLAGKVMAKRSHGIWGALLSAPPADKPLSPVRSAALMPVDCRAGFDPALLSAFVQALRAGSGVAGV